MGNLREAKLKWFTNAVYVLKDKYALPENVINEEEAVIGLIVNQDAQNVK